LLVKLLSGVGFEVREAVNGEDAIAQTQTWRPNLIWMDVRMPVMDGYEATRQIKQAAAAPKIIALTANAFEEERAAALAAGCDDFVRKPIQEEVLFSKIAEHLEVSYRYQDIDQDVDQDIPTAATAAPEAALSGLPTLKQSVREELWGLVDGDQVFLADYLSAHLEHLPRLMRSLREALAQQDSEALSLTAHTLKGMGLTFGAERLSELCRAVEQEAKADTAVVSQGQLEELESALAWLIAAIEQECRRLTPPN
ncbi:MAG TPA: response regulator, partial [Trichocoleus sp.]